MNNIKEFITKNKKMVGFIIAGVIVITLAVGIIILIPDSKASKTGYTPTKNEFGKSLNFFERKKVTDMESTLIAMGRDFYENLYYEQIAKTDEDRAKAASKYQNLGIKINVDNLSRYKSDVNNEALDAIINPATGETCNKENTKVIIYPNGNFGRTEYDIKVEFDCPSTVNTENNAE